MFQATSQTASTAPRPNIECGCSEQPTTQQAQRPNHHYQWRDGRAGATPGAQTIRLYGNGPQPSLRAHIATPKRKLPTPQTTTAPPGQQLTTAPKHWTSKQPPKQQAQRLNHHHQWRDGRAGATPGAQTIRLYGKPPQQSLRAHIATPKRKLPTPQTTTAPPEQQTTKRKSHPKVAKKTYTGSVCPGARFRSCVRLSALRER